MDAIVSLICRPFAALFPPFFIFFDVKIYGRFEEEKEQRRKIKECFISVQHQGVPPGAPPCP